MGDGITSYRDRLRLLVIGIVFLMVVALLYVFTASLYPPSHLKPERLVRIDISNLKEGESVTRKWDGLPIVVLHRTGKQIEDITAVISRREHAELHSLVPDPEGLKPELRSLRRDYFVAYKLPGGGIPCSAEYLGPYPEQSDYLQYPVVFMEQCKGMFFDAAGHALLGGWPGPDLSVPPHRYLSDTLIEIGPPSSDPAYSFNVQNRRLLRRSY